MSFHRQHKSNKPEAHSPMRFGLFLYIYNKVYNSVALPFREGLG
jgi:hypothetical protein